MFVGEYPNEENERDGMMQRIAAIDSIFESAPRLYLFISYRRNRRRVARSLGQVRIERVSFFCHYRYIARLFEEASFVYVHSVWNAMRILPFLRRARGKAIFDLHGVVPEEMRFVRKPVLENICQLVEREVIRNASLLLFVSQRMAHHFLNKYPLQIEPCKTIVLPNVDLRVRPERALLRRKREGGSLHFVYAGGIQEWQNIELILRTLARLATFRRDLRAAIYVPREAIQEVKTKVNSLGCDPYVEVASLAHREVMAKYQVADLGFVLREANLVNEVAMPTKLAEYITHGVVPVVLSPHIGDFVQYGYKYLTIEDLFDDRKLDRAALEAMQAANFESLKSIYALAVDARNRLASYCHLNGSTTSVGCC